MNYLAHIFLSDRQPELLIGNFIADSIRKSEVKSYSLDIQKGIGLHRKIDSYTDSHPLMMASVKRMRQTQGKYTPVVMDICYDHLLANNWNQFSDESLEEFAKWAYDLLASRMDDLPIKLQKRLPGMIKGNWLVQYKYRTGLEYTFFRVKQRLKFANRMEWATEDLYKNYTQYEEEFTAFFKDLQAMVQEEIAKIK